MSRKDLSGDAGRNPGSAVGRARVPSVRPLRLVAGERAAVRRRRAAGRHASHFPLSKISYTTIFVFFCLHTIGAHYTYAEVPYDEAWRSLTGHSLNEALGWERNNYDRVVHFGLRAAARLSDPRSVPAHRPACAASGATSCRST